MVLVGKRSTHIFDSRVERRKRVWGNASNRNQVNKRTTTKEKVRLKKNYKERNIYFVPVKSVMEKYIPLILFRARID